ncbi:MAG: ABC transporter substrate-binding protein [Ruminococcaceae bacterium]|nr:ABC transporter substrate-binding protein [Oscillospiraceae bacterium]
MKSKFLKTLSVILASLLLAGVLASCNYKNGDVSSTPVKTEKTDINVAVLKGPTALGMLKLMDDDKNDKAANDYEFEVFAAADQLVPKIVNKSIDIAAVPTNLAATLYKKTEKNVSIIAVNTLGVLSIVTNGVEIDSIEDLRGKTVYATGKGSTPEYALNYILEKNGLEVGKDVKVEYKSEHSELATLVISGKAEIAMLPQPFVTQVTTKNADVKIALDLSKEWKKLPNNDGNELVMGCLIVRNDFLKDNKAAVDAFLTEYAASTSYANDKVKETAQLSGDFGILDAAVVEKALPNCNIVYIDGEDMKKSVSAYLNTLLAANPASIGGAVPVDDFYYAK